MCSSHECGDRSRARANVVISSVAGGRMSLPPEAGRSAGLRRRTLSNTSAKSRQANRRRGMATGCDSTPMGAAATPPFGGCSAAPASLITRNRIAFYHANTYVAGIYGEFSQQFSVSCLFAGAAPISSSSNCNAALVTESHRNRCWRVGGATNDRCQPYVTMRHRPRRYAPGPQTVGYRLASMASRSARRYRDVCDSGQFKFINSSVANQDA